MRLGLLILLACASAFAADPQIDALRASLLEIRKEPEKSAGPRGATSQLTVAKHQLRDWIESQLPALAERGDEGELERKLNSELRDAKLFCGEGQSQQCPNWFLNGFLGSLALKRQSGFLIIQTGIGIECGFDESAYVYSWSSEGWRRVWQTEQNTYTKKEYRPQILNAVLISPYSKGNDYLVLTLGSESWCASTWHDVYYRAYRMGPDLETGPLLEGAEWAWLGKHYPPIQGSVSTGDVLVEFTLSSIDGGVHNREVVRHYRIDRDKITRVAPVALSPRDFVDEWLNTDWKESGLWSEPENRGATRDWHTKLHKDHVFGEFLYPTRHCAATPDLWQVGVDFSDPATPIGAPPKGTYFLVRWRPPYQFTMVQVSERASTACSEEDRNADDEPHTLFPVQEWR
jgi:hypothetical protein